MDAAAACGFGALEIGLSLGEGEGENTHTHSRVHTHTDTHTHKLLLLGSLVRRRANSASGVLVPEVNPSLCRSDACHILSHWRSGFAFHPFHNIPGPKFHLSPALHLHTYTMTTYAHLHTHIRTPTYLHAHTYIRLDCLHATPLPLKAAEGHHSRAAQHWQHVILCCPHALMLELLSLPGTK